MSTSGIFSPLGRVDHEVHAGGRRLAHPDGELDRLAGEALLEDVGEPLADGGVVAVAGQEHQHADVAAVGVAAYEDPQLAAPAGLHHPARHRGELVDGRVEQLVARVGLEGVDQGLAGVAARVEADQLEHVGGLLAQQRHVPDRLGVRRAGEQAEEAALAGDLAVLVERLHADVVEVRRAVHGGAGVGLGQHQQGVLAGHLGAPSPAASPTRGRSGSSRRMPSPLPGTPRRYSSSPVALEVVLAVAEEREVVVGQPLEEVDAAVDLVGGQRARRRRPAARSTISSTCCRIRPQSSTDSRTSRSTRCTSAAIASTSSS